jgi:hypothetical protein
MFEGVNKKLERAEYCLQNLKTLASDAEGFAYIPREKQQAMRANLDCFFFEIISAKDFFLQGINDSYAGLAKNEATGIRQLKICLKCKDASNALEVVKSIEKELSDKNSWLWRLNNYRNSSTHRDLLSLGHHAKIDPVELDKAAFEKMQQARAEGTFGIKPIFEGEERSIPPNVQRVNVKPENIKTYLLKDPEDPSQGNADIEVIPYCEQSLEKMTRFLKELYSQLSI